MFYQEQKHMFITFPRTSRGSLELIRTGLTLSPDSRPLSGDKLSKIPSNLFFSSGYKEKIHLLSQMSHLLVLTKLHRLV